MRPVPNPLSECGLVLFDTIAKSVEVSDSDVQIAASSKSTSAANLFQQNLRRKGQVMSQVRFVRSHWRACWIAHVHIIQES